MYTGGHLKDEDIERALAYNRQPSPRPPADLDLKLAAAHSLGCPECIKRTGVAFAQYLQAEIEKQREEATDITTIMPRSSDATKELALTHDPNGAEFLFGITTKGVIPPRPDITIYDERLPRRVRDLLASLETHVDPNDLERVRNFVNKRVRVGVPKIATCTS